MHERQTVAAAADDMRNRVARFPWEHSPLGPMAGWSGALRSTVKTLLASNYPMILTWGPTYTQIYNDAYAKLIGDKHPAALGIDIRVTLAEAWGVLGPMVENVMGTGIANWTPALPLLLERAGYREEAYFSVSHAPVEDDDGVIRGMLAVCSEQTDQILSSRRLNLLRNLATLTGLADVDSACSGLAAVLAGDRLDVPFALIYLREADGGLKLCEAVGVARTAALPPTAEAMAAAGAGEKVRVTDLPIELMPPAGAFGDPVRAALALPIAGTGDAPPVGVLVVAVSPSRALDDAYSSFFQLLVGQFASALGHARAYEAERRRAEQLAELDRAKTAFFANVSHEFRTPLTLLLGPIDDALADPALPPTAAGHLSLARRNGRRLLKLVNTLLDFSRLEAGRAAARFESTDLAGLTADLASVFRSAIEKAGLTLVVDCPPLAGEVFVDREMWEKVVLNLLSNALKFTPAGSITVKQHVVDGRVELRVIDTGVGVEAAELPRLFGRFYRAATAAGRTHEGTGIGLALVRELVQLHGGTVEARSIVGRGSTFVVSVPLGRGHLPTDQVDASSSGKASSPADLFVEEALWWLPEQGAMGASDGVAPGRSRVLLVEDNADMRQYVSRVLSESYAVTTEPDGVAAYAAAVAAPPDLILSDVMLPRLDGLGLLTRLRETPATRDVPVILLSARAGEDARVAGLRTGADDYMVKPFSARELMARVGAALQASTLRREAATARAAAKVAETRGEILDRVVDCFVGFDRDMRFNFVNKSAEAYFGLSREALLGRTLVEVTPQVAGSATERRFALALESGEPARFEIQSVLSGRWVELSLYPSAEGLSINFHDIHDRKLRQAEREALLESERVARSEAERVGRMKDEFLATLSHELRTPLNAIVGWSELLKAGANDAALVEEGVTVIARNARAQTRLIEDLLDMNRIVAGKTRLDVQNVDFAAVVSAAVEAVKPSIDAKGIRLRVLLDPTAPAVSGDPGRLQQVVWNLLTNAVKFTPKGGRIEVLMGRVSSDLELTVRDTGEGISPEFLPHLFERFRQADASTTRRHGGLGIGLSLVKSLIDLHGGRVRAESAGPGSGATFVVDLPVRVVRDEATGRFHPARAPSPLAEPPPLAPDIELRGVRVLVVDDEPDARELLRRLLVERAASVVVASSADDAERVLVSNPVDVIVSDIGMPDRDGYDLLRALRKAGIKTPAVALTAFARPEDRVRALHAGYQMHLPKPVEPAELIAVVASMAGCL